MNELPQGKFPHLSTRKRHARELPSSEGQDEAWMKVCEVLGAHAALKDRSGGAFMGGGAIRHADQESSS